MTAPTEVTVTGFDYLTDEPGKCAQLFASTPSSIPDPSGRPTRGYPFDEDLSAILRFTASIAAVAGGIR
jgi:hypothetical protein